MVFFLIRRVPNPDSLTALFAIPCHTETSIKILVQRAVLHRPQHFILYLGNAKLVPDATRIAYTSIAESGKKLGPCLENSSFLSSRFFPIGAGIGGIICNLSMNPA